MSPFVGNHDHTLDDKGRLVLPANYRLKLVQGAFAVPYDACLAILPTQEFERLAGHLQAQLSQGKADENQLRAFFSLAEEVTADSQGRMRLAPNLRELAQLERQVVLAGVIDHIEVWNPKRWASNFPEGPATFATSLMRTYGLGTNNA